MTRQLLTPVDVLVVAGLVAANAALGWNALTHGGAASGVEVVSSETTSRSPLGPPHLLEVAGPLGITVVEIGPDGARVLSSPCPNQICVRTGKITHPGQVVACVPNRVAVRLLGEGGRSAPDAVSR